MDRMFDEIARVLASQMPRRKAFKLLGGALVGGIAAALGGARVGAQSAPTPACKTGETPCAPKGANACCGKNQTCCTNCLKKGPFCITPRKTCPPTATNSC